MRFPLGAAALGCFAVPTLAVPNLTYRNETGTTPNVAVKNGTYSGIYSAEYDQDFFLGMPYAQKAARFILAEPLATAWNGTKEATAYPPHCIGYGGDEIGYPLSEDCLYLNVIRPAGLDDTADLPVAVWIHGGGLVMGGSADRRYNLSFIVDNAVQQGTPMLGVSLNYRLSAFGFLSGSEASEAGVTNIGFRDQRLALQWVRENIAAFGGAPDKVTIWGESSGAESVTAQVVAYNGRDDGLFRGAIAESGFGSILNRYPGGLNATTALQETFDNLVANTSCASTLGIGDSISCLSALPLDELHYALNVTAVGPWPPVLDGDFLADYPSKQIDNGAFVQVPIMIGCNSDEGTAFGPDSPVNTDADFAAAVRSTIDPNATLSSGLTIDAIVDTLAALYPDIQSVGIPSLESWPEVITPATDGVASLGLQYRRANALYGDMKMQYLRRASNVAWSAAGVPSWAYRFDVTVGGVPASVSATHFQEVAFVFHNLAGDGYATNPFAGMPASYRALSETMSTAWVNFVTGLDPNGGGAAGGGGMIAPEWPVYNTTDGGGVGREIVWKADEDGEASFVEMDDFRAAGMAWLAEHSLDVWGA
ncbi:Uu.00g014010.m01.CDS01 [Anthostomella pinea]|uniref:Carboxylic ester hydrolase n=1 Tax=Anthostomella pinea TaxID=933095 RepID=A0AAI8VY96_9PEZI|nr:Uu.00g014010.m01.CDS01 [Anthostomella pinea]